jgi:peptidoglycan/LPS O-acetylase OafA/YrhL
MFEGLRIKLGKLPWRIKRALGNMSYSLHLSGGPSTRRIKPSTTLTIVIALAVVGFILAGGVYDLLEHPISLLPTPSGYSVLISGTLGEQTLNESLIAGFLYMLGLGGLYMLLRSTRFAYRPRNAYLLLMIGTFTVLMVVYYSNALMSAKLGGG